MVPPASRTISEPAPVSPRVRAPHALRAQQELLEGRQVALGMLAHVVGEPGHEQRVVQLSERAHVDGRVVPGRALAGRGGEQLVADGVVDGARGITPATSTPTETQKKG